MNVRFLLILGACVCAFVASVIGFDLGWLGIDGGGRANSDYFGWVATSLLLFFAAALAGDR